MLAWAAIQSQGHPLHLTFTNLEFNTAKNRWVLTIKIFSDDFSTNLKAATGLNLAEGSKAVKEETSKILKNWLDNRFMIWFDTRPLAIETWKFEGIKVKDDATWITYTITAPLPVTEVRIRNSLLMDLYPDQKNLFIFVMGQTESAHEFKIKDQETTIKLNK